MANNLVCFSDSGSDSLHGIRPSCFADGQEGCMEEAIFSDPTLSIPTADLEEMKAADVLLQERPSATIWKILSVHLASTVSRHKDVHRLIISKDNI